MTPQELESARREARAAFLYAAGSWLVAMLFAAWIFLVVIVEGHEYAPLVAAGSSCLVAAAQFLIEQWYRRERARNDEGPRAS